MGTSNFAVGAAKSIQYSRLLSRRDRLMKFKSLIEKAKMLKNPDDAVKLINKILDKVEDMHSGVRKNPSAVYNPNRNDGRMYGILDDLYKITHAIGNVTILTKGHRIEIQKGGGFEMFFRATNKLFLSK